MEAEDSSDAGQAKYLARREAGAIRYVSHEEAVDASACRPHPIPGSDSQGNSDLRKITRNLSLTFALQPTGWP